MSAQTRSGPEEVKARFTDVRTALLVVGMHRSGTSALARVMSMLGCDLPRNVMPGGVGNELGHWESDEIYRLNEALLESAGARWDEWKPVNPGWYQSPKFAEFHRRAKEVLSEEFGQSRLFVLKDPRISLLAPFWLDVLADASVQPVVVVAVRNPEDVAHSMNARDGRDRAYGRLVWLRHLLESEFALRGCRRAYVSYDALLDNWPKVIERLQVQLDISLPRSMQSARPAIDEFLRDDQRHFASDDRRTIANPLLSPWVRECYEVFLRWSGDVERAEDYPALDRVREAFNCSIDAFSDLVAAGSIAGATALELEARIEELRSSESHVARLSEELALVVARKSEQEETAASADLALREQLAVFASQLADMQQREAEGSETMDALRIEFAERQLQLTIQLDRERLLLAEAQDGEKLMNDQLGQLRSALDQRRAELEDTHDEIALIRKAADEVEVHLRGECEAALMEGRESVRDLDAARAEIIAQAVALERAQDQEASLRSALASAEMRIDEMDAQLSKARDESQTLRNIVEEKDSALVGLRIELEATISEKNAEIGQIAAAGDAANEQIGVRFQEIAVLSRALQDERDAGQAREQAAERIMEINKVLTRARPWQSWLPQHFVRKQQLDVLKRRQLFDADIYLALNEDVAREGTDALRHYLLHGHREGRRTGLD